MRRVFRELAIAGVFAIVVFAVNPSVASPFTKGASLQVFTFPAVIDGHYADDPFPSRAGAESYFSIARLRDAGFDHVRLPVDVGPFLDDANEKNWLAFKSYFRTLVSELQKNRLGVIVTLVAPAIGGQIPEDQLDGLSGPRFQKYLTTVEKIASELESWKIDTLALEPMNEPQQACVKENATDWTEYQKVLLKKIRERAPSLWLGVTGGCWSQIQGLDRLSGEAFRDKRTFLSIHFYDPFLFTHQGADWTLDIMPLIDGLPYPARAGSLSAVLANEKLKAAARAGGTQAQTARRAESAIRNYFAEDNGPSSISAKMDILRTWCVHNDVPPSRVVFTEFGAMKTSGDDESRRRWLRDTSSAIAARGWGWTLWVLKQGPFGLDKQGRYDERLLQAIGIENIDVN